MRKKESFKKKPEKKIIRKNLQAIEQFIQTQDVETLEFDDKLVRQFVDKILILDEAIEVTFKTGACARIDG